MQIVDINTSEPNISTNNIISLSVVIPTLGGESLLGTILKLNNGTKVPEEILICIPKEDAYKTDNLLFPNVRVVKTNCRGQVAQRIEGFKLCSGNYVLQLDDDIELPSHTLGCLISKLSKLGRGNVIGPVYVEKGTGRKVHKIESGISGFTRNVFYSIFCGAKWGANRMGTITQTGHCFGVDPDYCKSEALSVAYLPGGCILSFKEDLEMTNFFPYKGKAYCEDLIHSHLRTRLGILHWVLLTAECFIDAFGSENDNVSLQSSIKARKFFVKLSGRSLLRLEIYEAMTKIRRFF